MVRRPLFTLVLVSILALGLGANAAMFSVVDSVLLEPLPYPEADRLVWVRSLTPEGSPNSVAAEDWRDYGSGAAAIEHLAAYGLFPQDMVITGEEEPEVLSGAAVSANFFRVFGVDAVLGRTFMEEDAEEAAGNPVILSYGLWERRFGGEPGILGRTITLDGTVFEVAGVMPDGFAFPSWAQVWRPFRMSERMAQGRGNNNFFVVGRLADGATVGEADAEVKVIAASIAADHPEAKQDWSAQAIPLLDVFVGDVRSVLWMLLGAVGLALLIACANVAALLLARATRRQGEVAIRVAMGASRSRIVRQMLTESTLTALGGGVLGLGVAHGALKAMSSLGGGSLPRLAFVELDGTALLFTLVVSLATGILFGLAPALRAPKLQLAESLKEGGRGLRSGGSLRLQSGLVVGQVALSLVLLVGSGLLIRSFLHMQGEELGFDPHGVVVAEIQLPRSTYGADRPTNDFYDALLDDVRSLPGVEGAGVTTRIPVTGGRGPWNYVHAEGRPAATPADRRGATRRVVSAGYFEAMGIPLLRGRTFERSDGAGEDAPPVVVINRSLEELFFPGEDPVGRSIVLTGWDPPVDMEILGVVGDVRLGGVEDGSSPTMYWPQAITSRFTSTLVVRTSGDPAALAPQLRQAVDRLDANVPIADLVPMSTVVTTSLAEGRFRTLLLAAFAGLALVLASLGLYGVLAQLVGGRTQEVGVRMALGARPSDIMGWVLGRGLRLTLIGLALGVVGAAAASWAARGLLFGVRPLDPATYAGTVVVLTLVAVGAAFLPGWRATRVNPVESLRAE
jgi:predicted permease